MPINVCKGIMYEYNCFLPTTKNVTENISNNPHPPLNKGSFCGDTLQNTAFFHSLLSL